MYVQLKANLNYSSVFTNFNLKEPACKKNIQDTEMAEAWIIRT